MPETVTRSPPHDEHAERALLGAILCSKNGALASIRARGVGHAVFYNMGHQAVFQAIVAAAEKDGSYDPVHVSRRLRALSPDVDLQLISDCMDACTTAQNLGQYATRVLHVATQRDALKLMIEYGELIADPAEDFEYNLNDLRSRVGALCRREEEQREGTPFPVVGLAEIEDYTADPERHHLAGHGWIRRQAGTLITGGTGIGKSVLVQQIALSMAAGVPILGCIPVNPKAGRALIIQAEQDMETLQRDFRGIMDAMDLDDAALQAARDRLKVQHLWLADRFHDRVREAVESAFRPAYPDVVIIDNYQSYTSDDINDSAAWAAWIGGLMPTLYEIDAAVVLVDHTPKPRDRANWTKSQSVYMAAGTSKKANWARTSGELTELEDGRYRLRFGKNAERTGLVDEDGRIVRDLYLEHSGNPRAPAWHTSADQEEPAKGSRFRDAVIEYALEHPAASYQEIADAVGCSKGCVANNYPEELKK